MRERGRRRDSGPSWTRPSRRSGRPDPAPLSRPGAPGRRSPVPRARGVRRVPERRQARHHPRRHQRVDLPARRWPHGGRAASGGRGGTTHLRRLAGEQAREDGPRGMRRPAGRPARRPGLGLDPRRERLVVDGLDMTPHVMDAPALYRMLREESASAGSELNVEGAVVVDGVIFPREPCGPRSNRPRWESPGCAVTRVWRSGPAQV